MEVDFKLNQATYAKGLCQVILVFVSTSQPIYIDFKMEFEHQIKNNITFNPHEQNVILLEQLLKL